MSPVVSGLAETVRDLVPGLANRDDADAERYPADNIADLVSAGVIRAPFPAAAGGAGCTLLDAVDAVEVMRIPPGRMPHRPRIAGCGPSRSSAWPPTTARAHSTPRATQKEAPANFIEIVQPLTYWFALFAAIPLGCAAAIRRELSTPVPESPALRLRSADAQMREEALRAYLHETARAWRPGAGPAYAARALRRRRTSRRTQPGCAPSCSR